MAPSGAFFFMKRLLDYDPATGIKTFHDYDHATGTTYIEQSQDVSKLLDYTKAKANDTSYKQQGIKQDWYHFARVPALVLHDILVNHGLDWSKSEDLPKIEQLLQRDYKKLLTVNRI